MIKEIPVFNNGTYDKKCPLFEEISIGSVMCVGHSEIEKIKKCKYCVSHKQENEYYLPILKETIKIVSSVVCSRPAVQLTFFQAER